MSLKSQTQPDLQTYIRELIDDVKIEINCIQIGKIEKFYLKDKTADVSICFKKLVNNVIQDYPILLKCPVLGNKITVPIETGEYCIVLFNDRNIDSWFETGQVQVPYSSEKHNINNGIIITGLNSLINSIIYDNSAINLNYDTKINGILKTSDNIDCPSITPRNGATGVFVDTPSGKSITIVNGIITKIT